MPDFAVSVAIRGDDQISGNLKRLTKGVDRFGKKADMSFRLASRSAEIFKSVVGGILVSRAISAGFNALRMGAREVARGFIEMDQALTSAGAKFQLSQLGAEGAAAAMRSLNDAARQVGASTEFTATEAARGLEFLAMAGFTTEQAIAALPAMVDLATASNSDFARASDIASDALGAFGMASSDAAERAKNLTRISDVFAQTTAGANVDMENLFETMKMSAPIMTTAGQSLESFAAMAAVMGNAGIKGSLAGTTLKNVIDRLVKPAGEAKKVLKNLGVATQDSGGNMRDVADIMADFGDATKDMGTAQRTAAISTVFGMRAVSGVATILDTGIPTLRNFRDGLEGAQGASKRMADEMRKSLTNRIKVLKSGLMELGMKVLEAFQDKFPGALDAAIKAIQGFDVAPLVNGIKAMVEMVKGAWNWFDKWKFVIFLLVGALAAFRLALALTAVVEMFIALATGATTITKLWAASQWAVNAALLANPVTWIILAIIALIAVIALVIVYWDELQLAATNVAISIANAFGEVWYGIKVQARDVVSYVINAWRSLKASLGFDVSDMPTRDDLSKWFGVDEVFRPVSALESYGSASNAPDMGGEPPNRANREARKSDINLSGLIEVISSGGASAAASGQGTVNGHKAPGVDWRSKGGQNSGA